MDIGNAWVPHVAPRWAQRRASVRPVRSKLLRARIGRAPAWQEARPVESAALARGCVGRPGGGRALTSAEIDGQRVVRGSGTHPRRRRQMMAELPRSSAARPPGLVKRRQLVRPRRALGPVEPAPSSSPRRSLDPRCRAPHRRVLSARALLSSGPRAIRAEGGHPIRMYVLGGALSARLGIGYGWSE